MPTELFVPLPATAAWVLEGVHDGFEVTRFERTPDAVVLTGTSVGVEDATAWDTSYRIELSPGWVTRRVHLTRAGGVTTELEVGADRRWHVDGRHDPSLDGLLDVDLEVSTVTNTIALHRLALAPGSAGSSRAVYLRAHDPAPEVLDQTHARLEDSGPDLRFRYRAPRFDYDDTLVVAPDGVVRTYPSISRRVL